MQRKGAKHMPFYRIVVADSRSPRDGRFIEQLGYYDPLKDPAEIKVDTEKVIGWLSKGAQPSETVRSLFSRVGIMETWHHVRQGKSLDELRHIEDEARKRAEAQAAMQKRKSAEEKVAKKAAAKADAGDETPAAEEPAPEAEAVEEEAAEPAAEPEEKAEPAEEAGAEDAPEEKPKDSTETAEAEPEPQPETTEGTEGEENEESKPDGE